jgi:hypothetical protein
MLMSPYARASRPNCPGTALSRFRIPWALLFRLEDRWELGEDRKKYAVHTPAIRFCKLCCEVQCLGRFIALKLSEGQAHDGNSAVGLLGRLSEGPILLSGRAYDSGALSEALAARGARGSIKPMPGRWNVPTAFLYRFRYLAL